MANTYIEAEVLEVNYKDNNVEGNYIIKAKPIENTSSGNTDTFLIAKPLDLKTLTLPTKGEVVFLFKGPTPQSDSAYKIKEYYYTNAINLQNNINHNALPTIHEYASSGNSADGYNSSAAGATNSSGGNDETDLGDTISEQSINPLQLYEGDTALQSRWGSSIRFGHNNDGNSPFSKTQEWKGTTHNPLLILSNGHGNTASTNKFITEDASKDASSIYLTKQSKINTFKPAQKNYGQGVTNGTSYDKAQILLTSERVTISSNTDYIILDGKKSVNIATPNWATDMDKYFTLLDDIFTELKNLHTEVTNLNTELTATNTQINTLNTGLASFAAGNITAKTAVPIFAPLAPPDGALQGVNSGLISPIVATTSKLGVITGKLTKIGTTLGTLTTRYNNLKQ